MGKSVTFKEDQDKLEEYMDRIKSADKRLLEFDICPSLRNEEFGTIEREQIAKSIQSRYKVLIETTIPIGEIRKNIAPAEIITGNFIEDKEKPKWCHKWIYVNSHTGFMNLKTLKLHKSESFNVENGKYVSQSRSMVGK